MARLIDPDEFFWRDEYCPKCGIQIWSIYTHVLCACGWEGMLKNLLDKKGLRKLKLEKLNDTNN